MHLDNHSYNIIKTITEKAEALWAYDKYLEDSKNCKECTKFWQNLKEEDGMLLDELRALLNSHIEKGQMEEIKTEIKGKRISHTEDHDLYRAT
jgi:hypothetical protein